jgi:phosphoglycolate phosphatase-like HAD superfamily hydrolase
MTATAKKISALDTLKALASKKPQTSVDPGIPASIGDPAIAGAKKVKAVVQLGTDPAFMSKASNASELHKALERAASDFAVLQSEVRKYGASKRKIYNETFKANVTTVCVPYEVETPDGKETRFIQVICSNKYSVQGDVVLKNREDLGDYFDKLFTVETEKVLKPDSEDLFRGILGELGLDSEQVENAMANLLEEKNKVKTREGYEQESQDVPESVKIILDQSVTRSEPGLKFQSNQD